MSLLAMLDADFTADVIFAGLVEGVIYFDILNGVLSDTSEVYLHANPVRAKFHWEARKAELADHPVVLPPVKGVVVGDMVPYAGEMWSVARVNETQGVLTRDGGFEEKIPTASLSKLVEEQLMATGRATELAKRNRKRWEEYSDKDRTEALRRLKAIRNDGVGVAKRTFARWLSRYRKAKSSVGRIMSLLPENANKGRRSGRFSDDRTESIAIEVIQNIYNTPDCTTVQKAWDIYCAMCIEAGVKPMSYVAFGQRARKNEDVWEREGKRRAHTQTTIPLELDAREPLSGVRPHEVIYIDNTLLPIFTIGPRGEEWQKLWLCAAVDGHTTQCRSYLLTYRPPSAQTALMVLRDYIRRHECVPRVIVVDGGADFDTKALDEFCGFHDIDKRGRSSGKPRGGNRIENMFAVLDKEFVAGLEGNSRKMREHAREMTKAVDPRDRRVWGFVELANALEYYLMVERPMAIHPKLGMSQIEFEVKRLRETGERDEDPIYLDETQMLLTSMFPKQEKHKVKPHEGIWESGAYYWHDDFARLSNKSLEVRIEPWYAGVIYVNTGRRWVVATCRDKERWKRTSYEVQYAARQQRLENVYLARRDKNNPQRARARTFKIDPRHFSAEVHLKQQIERLYYIAAWKVVSAKPLPENVQLAQTEAQQVPEEDASCAPNPVEAAMSGALPQTESALTASVLSAIGQPETRPQPESAPPLSERLETLSAEDVDFEDVWTSDGEDGFV
ncbi:hypothetical protein ACFQI9_34700 [Paraburkholderia dipogonis]